MWSVCVLSCPRARNVSQTHCNNFKWHDWGVRVLWVTAGDGYVLMQGAPWGLLVTTTCVHVYKHTDTATCLSPPQHGSTLCVLIGVCFISARRSERVSLLQSMGLSFFSFFLLRWCLDSLWQVLDGVILRSVVSLWSLIWFFFLNLWNHIIHMFSPCDISLSKQTHSFLTPQTDWRDAACPLR